MGIAPHGGKLVDRRLYGEELTEARARAGQLPRLNMEREILRDIENIAKGVFSPLEGPLCQDDLRSVLHTKRLTNWVAWTFPIVVAVSRDAAGPLEEGCPVALGEAGGEPLAILHLEQKYGWDRREFASCVFGTEDGAHPGVARLQGMGDTLLGGKIGLLRELANPYSDVTLEPKETRILFREKGWRTVGAFQTRNIPHAGHESMQKTLLSLVDGIMIHPLIGRKKQGDFTDSAIIHSYQALIEHYFPAERVVLSALCTEMRYAGPREAIHHAIMRKNHGCTHFVVGRDHAGVGKFYPPEAAIEIFDEFPDLEIEPVTIRGDFFWCHACGALGSERTCPHDPSNHISFSGTEVRAMLNEKRVPPKEIIRAEVFAALAKEEKAFVE